MALPRTATATTLEGTAGPLAHETCASANSGSLAGPRGALHAHADDGRRIFTARGLLVAFTGQPRLAGGGETADAERIATAIAECYRSEPVQAARLLKGPFALAVVDAQAGTALLSVDRMGIHELSWTQRDGGLAFASRADRLAPDDPNAEELDPQALYNYLFHHVIPRPATIFRGVHRLGPGEYLHYADGRVSTAAYWRPEFDEDDPKEVTALQQGFRDTLRQAVARASEGGRPGAFLSGGTDSSTITGMLGEVTADAPRTYSIGFDAPGYDETAYARIAAKRFGARHHEYFVTPADVASAIPRIAAWLDQPYGNASIVPAYYCAQLARDDGIDVLLGGDGGDELFAGNARYAKEWLFSLYTAYFPAWVRRGLVEPPLRLPGLDQLPPLRKARRYVEQARRPVPERMHDYNLLLRLGPERVFEPDFLQMVDSTEPQRAVAAEYARFTSAAPLNRLLAVDMKFTLADDDLRKVRGAGAMTGLDIRFPFLDDDLVALASRVPAGAKMRRTRLRHFFKEALADYLPREILEKEKHGFGLPFGVWLREEQVLRDLARDSLDGLRQRGVIRPAMIDELTGRRIEEHADYFGTLTWVLVMLEQWLRHRGVRAND